MMLCSVSIATAFMAFLTLVDNSWALTSRLKSVTTPSSVTTKNLQLAKKAPISKAQLAGEHQELNFTAVRTGWGDCRISEAQVGTHGNISPSEYRLDSLEACLRRCFEVEDCDAIMFTEACNPVHGFGLCALYANGPYTSSNGVYANCGSCYAIARVANPTVTPTVFLPTFPPTFTPSFVPTNSDPSFYEQNVQCVRPETDLISPAFCPRNLFAFGAPFSPIPSADARVCKPRDNDDELKVKRAHFALDTSTTPPTVVIRVSISTPDDVSINDNFKVVFKGFSKPSKYKSVITTFKFNGRPLQNTTTFQIEAQLKPDMMEINEVSIKIKQSVVNGERAFVYKSCKKFPMFFKA
jgi:hypothetical protein